MGSGYNAAYYIAHVLKLPKGKKVFLLGEPGLEAELQSFGIDYIGGHKVRMLFHFPSLSTLSLLRRANGSCGSA